VSENLILWICSRWDEWKFFQPSGFPPAKFRLLKIYEKKIWVYPRSSPPILSRVGKGIRIVLETGPWISPRKITGYALGKGQLDVNVIKFYNRRNKA